MTGRFDAVEHKYYINDVEVPSTTRILKLAARRALNGDPLASLAKTETAPWYTIEARERGTALHRLTEVVDALGAAQAFGEAKGDVVLCGRLGAYVKFLYEQQPTMLESEQQVYDAAMQYAGTIDRVLKLRNGRIYIVDFKPAPAAWHPIQLGAYARTKGIVDKANLYLKPNGEYKWTAFHNRPADAARFLKARVDVGDTWRAAA